MPNPAMTSAAMAVFGIFQVLPSASRSRKGDLPLTGLPEL